MNQIAPPEMSPSPDLNPEQFASADGQQVNLIGIPRAAQRHAGRAGAQAFPHQQLWQWLYWHGVTDFDAMTNLSKDFRQKLADEFVIERPQVSEALNSVDGTAKWLLKFPDGNEVETVHIPEADAVPCASPARSAVPSPASSATPARRSWSVT